MKRPFVCPVCHEPLKQEAQVLTCANRHSFDLARQGYVNLLLKKPENLYEDKALFAARRAAFAAGFFDGLAEAILAQRPRGIVLDAGCGEGSMLRRIAPGGTGIGLDIAKPAVQMAAGVYKDYAWCVADLCNIPLANAAVDTVLNILTPANYREFARVLAPQGTLIKAVPNAEHLAQLREAGGIGAKRQDQAQAIALFGQQFSLERQTRVCYTVQVEDTLARQVYQMTPMTWHRAVPAQLPDRITVDVTLLVGSAKG